MKPSSPAPGNRSNILQQMLLVFMVIWTGFLIFNRPQPGPSVPAGDLFKTLQKQNVELDANIAATKQAYDRSVDEQLNAKKIDAATAQAKKIESTILVADTQLKISIKDNKIDRVRDAYHLLVSQNRQLRDRPEWNQPVKVADVRENAQFKPGWDSWTGRQIYDRVVSELSQRQKQELVFGFIPGYQLMDFLVHLTGANPNFSYALAGFFLALLVRTAVFRLATKQIMSGRRMSQLLPMINEIKKAFPDDQVQQQQKTMALYKEYGVNPFAGCGPALVQMPLFYTIYLCMLAYQFEFQKGVFLWVNPTTSRQTNGFLAPNLGQQDTILILLYGLSMIVSQLLMPVTDPTQVRQQRLMSVGITVIFTAFMFTGAVPVVSGFVLYWIFTNLLATAQSLYLYRQPLPPLEKVNTPTGGAYPTGGMFGGKLGNFMERMQQMQEEQTKGTNGSAPKTSESKNGTFLGTGETKTGTPGKHKPKRRK